MTQYGSLPHLYWCLVKLDGRCGGLPASVNVFGAASRPRSGQSYGQEDRVTLGFDFLFKRSDLNYIC